MASETNVDSDRRTVRSQQHQINTQRRRPGKRTHTERPGGTKNTVEMQAGISISFDIERVNPLV